MLPEWRIKFHIFISRDTYPGDDLVRLPQRSKMYRLQLVYNIPMYNTRTVVHLLMVEKVADLIVKVMCI